METYKHIAASIQLHYEEAKKSRPYIPSYPFFLSFLRFIFVLIAIVCVFLFIGTYTHKIIDSILNWTLEKPGMDIEKQKIFYSMLRAMLFIIAVLSIIITIIITKIIRRRNFIIQLEEIINGCQQITLQAFK